MKERNNTITYLKATGIILMVLGHSFCSIPYVIPFLSMFHMPLFFIVSGFCFTPRNLDTPKQYLIKRIKGLYVPFVKWGIIFTLFHNVFYHLHIYDAEYGLNGIGTQPMNMEDTLSTLWLIITQMRCTPLLLGGYWFLTALFTGSILGWCLLRYVRSPRHYMFVVTLLFIIVHYTGFHIQFLNVNEQAFAAMWFFVTGHFLAQKRIKEFNCWAIAGSIILTCVGMFFWMMQIADKTYDWRIFPYMITATLCTWAFYSILKHWNETRSIASSIMLFIGNNTLTILTWHLLFFKPVSLIIIKIYDLPINQLGEYPVIFKYAAQGWWLVYLLTTLSLSCLLVCINQKVKFRLRPTNDKD